MSDEHEMGPFPPCAICLREAAPPGTGCHWTERGGPPRAACEPLAHEPTAEELAALRAVAEKATPGPWAVSERSEPRRPRITCASSEWPTRTRGQWIAELDGGKRGTLAELVSSGERADHDAAFIAAANPEMVLQLVATIERLRGGA